MKKIEKKRQEKKNGCVYDHRFVALHRFGALSCRASACLWCFHKTQMA